MQKKNSLMRDLIVSVVVSVGMTLLGEWLKRRKANQGK